MVGGSTKEEKGRVASQTLAELGLHSVLLTPTTCLLYHFASWCKLFVKSEFSKQRHNLIMRLELNMQIWYSSKIVLPSSCVDCQIWIYRTDICYLYTYFYIWSASDFPLDIVFECLWGKHQGFLEWLGFLKICLFLYLFYMKWKFCHTHFNCMENMFQSLKTAKKTQTRQLQFYKLGEGEEQETSIIACWAFSCLIWVLWETFCLLPP